MLSWFQVLYHATCFTPTTHPRLASPITANPPSAAPLLLPTRLSLPLPRSRRLDRSSQSSASSPLARTCLASSSASSPYSTRQASARRRCAPPSPSPTSRDIRPSPSTRPAIRVIFRDFRDSTLLGLPWIVSLSLCRPGKSCSLRRRRHLRDPGRGLLPPPHPGPPLPAALNINVAQRCLHPIHIQRMERMQRVALTCTC